MMAGGAKYYDRYFFNVANNSTYALILKAKFGVADNDVMDRCKECGCTIGEHRREDIKGGDPFTMLGAAEMPHEFRPARGYFL